MTVPKFTRSSTRIGRARLHEGLLSYVAHPSFGLRNTGTKKKGGRDFTTSRPEGTALWKALALRRRSYTNPGPNFAWHIDGYDKLRPKGFPIPGAVDGFSRRVMWLKICSSNNDPSHVASLFYDCVKPNRGCPIVLRTDCGTENVTMASMQCYFSGKW